MTRHKWLLTFFMASFVITIIGTIRKIMNPESGEGFLIAAVIVSLICGAIAIYEVATSQRTPTGQKVLWILSFVFLGWIGILIYLLVGRKNVVANDGTTTSPA